MYDKQFEMAPGFYRVGDPCYSIEEWEEFLEAFWETDGGVFDFKGVKVACWYTAYGDGCYDYMGYDIPVDAGCIALLPESICTKDDGGWVPQTFKRQFTVERDSAGTFNFDGELIYTGDEEDDVCECCGR